MDVDVGDGEQLRHGKRLFDQTLADQSSIGFGDVVLTLPSGNLALNAAENAAGMEALSPRGKLRSDFRHSLFQLGVLHVIAVWILDVKKNTARSLHRADSPKETGKVGHMVEHRTGHDHVIVLAGREAVQKTFERADRDRPAFGSFSGATKHGSGSVEQVDGADFGAHTRLEEAVRSKSRSTADIEYVQGFGLLRAFGKPVTYKEFNLLGNRVPHVPVFLVVDLRLEFMEGHVHGGMKLLGRASTLMFSHYGNNGLVNTHENSLAGSG